MRLSKLYSNQSQVLEPIMFGEGLNVVLAEIRLPENKAKDTHNLGKTTLGQLIDFCLLSTRDSEMFLFKHFNRFSSFAFFLELSLLDGSFVTVKRSVVEASKVSFKRHMFGLQDFADIPDSMWDHAQMPFDRSREMLDGILGLTGLKDWSFRKGLGYLLRSQDDYHDVFQLARFASAHVDWKPYLAGILGFDSRLIESHYRKEDELKEQEATVATINSELGGTIEDVSKVEGMLQLKVTEADKKQKLLDAFDFRSQDKDQVKKVVDEYDVKIGDLNARRYSLMVSRKRVALALEDEEIDFNPDQAESVFKEAGVLFSGQLKQDFEQLISFSKAITLERRAYLQEELGEIDVELKEVNASLTELGRHRARGLAFLSSTDTFRKYKDISDDLVTVRADIVSLERQKSYLHRLQELRSSIRKLRDECRGLQSKIEEDVDRQNSDAAGRFASIRGLFSEIIEQVIDRKALITVQPNSYGHLEFRAEILDEAGNATSADRGNSYRKLLCVAFDMAVLRAHLDEEFPRFLYHDGAFETLDDRKKENLIEVMREYASLGIQQVVTLIDSDLPRQGRASGPVFTDEEIVLRLHDEGESGRLFKMPSW